MSETRCRLYLITPPKFEAKPFADVLKRALDAGDVACVQMRLKGASDEEIMRAGDLLLPVTQRAGAAFILNDRPDLAARLSADGVHVGQEDASYSDARALMGHNRIVGITCHNIRHLAIEAAEAGADYVAFGAFFPTATKAAETHAEPEIIQWWSEMMVVPSVAIGGITVENCPVLIEAGADFLAVASGVWDYPQGPAAAVKAFNGLFKLPSRPG
ncbi:MAG TPA: thiamine phosphate synthase [Micropepsaceae bacterium]|nr:thiamine phosphate synthase [Micropepsaceae bacterium]